jgi:group I intron endonuclease
MIGDRNYGESGVYIIQSKTKPNRVYVGSAVAVERRRWEHTTALRKGKHHSHKLQNHFNKYGENDLIFDVIESGDYIDKNHLLSREQGWFYHFDDKKTGKPYFNECALAGSVLGIKQSEETKKKKSLAIKGRKRRAKTQMEKDHQSDMLKGKPLSDVHKAKLKGHKHSEETKAVLREKLKGNKNGVGNKSSKGKPSLKKGKKLPSHSPQTILNQSIGMKKWWDNHPMEKNKRSDMFSGEKNPFYGKKHKPESIMKGVSKNKGRKASSETKEKQSISLKKAWAEGRNRGSFGIHTPMPLTTRNALKTANEIPILQFNDKNIFIKEWGSIKNACMCLGISYATIIKSIKLGIIVKNNFAFQYKPDA